MADYRSIAAQDARKYGIPVNVFLNQIGAESNWDPDAHSGSNAQGIAQFIPSTARAYGLSNPYDPVAALDAAARYMRDNLKRYGTIERALSAYNSGKPDAYLDPNFAHGQTYNYVRKIVGGGNVPVPAGAVPVRPDAAAPAPPAGLNLAAIFNQGNKLLGLPGFAPTPAAALSSPGPTPTPDRSMPALPTPQNVKRWVTTSRTADRAGVRTNPRVLTFVASIAQIYGRPLNIGTGTNHNQFVVGTNRESQHWQGNAADIPATGAQLTRLGQDALIAAGMPVAQARKQKGGVYNVGGHNILFNTRVGGNHYNHLHVGI